MTAPPKNKTRHILAQRKSVTLIMISTLLPKLWKMPGLSIVIMHVSHDILAEAKTETQQLAMVILTTLATYALHYQ